MTIKEAATAPIPAWLATLVFLLPLGGVVLGVINDRSDMKHAIEDNTRWNASQDGHLTNTDLVVARLEEAQRAMERKLDWLIWNAGGDPEKVSHGRVTK